MSMSKKTLFDSVTTPGHLHRVLQFLKEGGPVDTKLEESGLTLLGLAAKHGNYDVVELLIANSADLNARDYFTRTPLYVARKAGMNEVVELLKNHGAVD
jgi:ankyrin repeat protein